MTRAGQHHGQTRFRSRC